MGTKEKSCCFICRPMKGLQQSYETCEMVITSLFLLSPWENVMNPMITPYTCYSNEFNNGILSMQLNSKYLYIYSE